VAADVSLVFDIAYSASYDKMATTLNKIVSNLESSKYTKIKFSIDENSLTKMQTQLKNIVPSGVNFGNQSRSFQALENNIQQYETVLKNAELVFSNFAKSNESFANNKIGAIGQNADSTSLSQLRGTISAMREQYNIMSDSTQTEQARITALRQFTDLQALQSVQTQNVRLQVNSLNKEMRKKSVNDNQDVLMATKLNKLQTQLLTTYQKHGAMIKQNTELDAKYQTVLQNLKTPGAYKTRNEAEKAVSDLNKEMAQAGIYSHNLGVRLKELFSQHLNTALVMGGLHLIMSSLSGIYNSIKDIDTAMTELRRVTDESETTYSNFLNDAAKRADQYGSSMSDIINATADFSRLGFNLDESTKLADAAVLYKNVGDGISDISEATQDIVSTMQAFNISPNQVTEIVDKFNKVGNTEAISSQGVGDALKRSASALATANNTLDESVAMAAAMNTVVQDTDKVGTVLKTYSMYLRAAKTDAEAAGESTEGMANSVSELRSELLKLTKNKVDIMKDDGRTYKSTYQISEELSKVWKDISDVDQANILELIGGKRNANAVSALIENFDIAKRALNTSESSQGSAVEEQEKYLNSIEGHLAKLGSAFEKFSTKTLDSDLVKGSIDFLKGIVNLLTDIMSCGDGLIIKIGAVVAAIKIAQALHIVDFIKNCSISIFSQIVAIEGLTAALSTLNNKGIVGVLSAIPKLIAGLISMRKSGQSFSQMMTTMNLTPASLGISALLLVIGGVVAAYQTGLIPSTENYKKKLNESKEQLSDTVSKLSTLNSELETTQKRINELQKKKSLTVVEKNELETLKKTNSELERKIALAEKDKKIQTKQVEGDFQDTMASYVDAAHHARVSNNSAKYFDGYATKREWLQEQMQYYRQATDKGLDASEYLKNLQEASKFFADIDVLDQIDYNSASQETKQYLDYIEDFNNQLLLLTDRANNASVIFDSLWTGDRFSKAREQLEQLYKAGALDTDKLKSLASDTNSPVSEFIGNLEKLGLIDIFSDPTSAFEGVVNWIKEFEGAENSVSKTTKKTVDTLDEITKSIDSIQSAYQKSYSAISDYNKYGYLSIDNLQSLLGLSDKYINALFDENGKLNLNTEAYKKLAVAELQELAVRKSTDLISKIMNMGEEAAQTYATANAIDKKTKSTYSLIDALVKQAYIEAKAKDVANGNLTYTKALDAALPTIAQYITLTDKGIDSLDNFASATLGASVTVKTATEIQKDNLEKQKKIVEQQKKNAENAKSILEKRKSDLEDAKKAIEDLVDSVQSMIEKEKELEKESLTKRKESADEVIDKYKEQLELQEEQIKKAKELAEKESDVAKNALSVAITGLDDSSAGKKAHKEAIDSYNDSKSDLSDTLRENTYDERLDQLDKLKDANDKYYDDKIDAIDKYLNNSTQLYKDACKMIDNDTGTLYSQLKDYTLTYTTTTATEFDRMWSLAQEANQKYNTNNLDTLSLLNSMQGEIYILSDRIDDYSNSIDGYSQKIDGLSTKIDSLSDAAEKNKDSMNGANGAAVNYLNTLKQLQDQPTKFHGYKITYNGKAYKTNKTNKEDAETYFRGKISNDWYGGRAIPAGSLWSQMKAYASGTTSARGGLSLVGEHGAELRLLNQGDGIIPADLTERLMNFAQNPTQFIDNTMSAVGRLKELSVGTNNLSVSPVFNFNINGDVTNDTVNRMKQEFSKICDTKIKNFMQDVTRNIHL
jgi:TP901 family phage tail tape measure protein